MGNILHQDSKFISPKPSNQGICKCIFQVMGSTLDDFIANRMTVCIIYQLKIINVNQNIGFYLSQNHLTADSKYILGILEENILLMKQIHFKNAYSRCL